MSDQEWPPDTTILRWHRVATELSATRKPPNGFTADEVINAAVLRLANVYRRQSLHFDNPVSERSYISRTFNSVMVDFARKAMSCQNAATEASLVGTACLSQQYVQTEISSRNSNHSLHGLLERIPGARQREVAQIAYDSDLNYQQAAKVLSDRYPDQVWNAHKVRTYLSLALTALRELRETNPNFDGCQASASLLHDELTFHNVTSFVWLIFSYEYH